jgi:ubiquinone/menaquinone biosynthesis C-methylase UbiE
MNKHEFQASQSFTDPNNIEYWDSLYDQNDYYGSIFRKRMETALSWIEDIGLTEKSKILDAGCGAGRLVYELVQKGINSIGLDYSHGMLVKAKALTHPIKKNLSGFSQGSIENLPLKNSSIDVIISLGVLAYIKSKDRAFQEFARVLKPEGTLVVSFINRARIVRPLKLQPILKSFYHKVTRNGINLTNESDKIGDRTNHTAYFLSEIRNSLEAEGFKVIEYRTIPLELFALSGKELFSREMSMKITLFFERFSNIPIIGSFGGMYIIKAKKNQDIL